MPSRGFESNALHHSRDYRDELGIMQRAGYICSSGAHDIYHFDYQSLSEGFYVSFFISIQKAILQQFGLPASKLRIYLHYQPSYYHLHVHFTHIKLEAPGTGVERAHLLSDVIENIELNAGYYQKKTLTYLVKENDALFSKYKEADTSQWLEWKKDWFLLYWKLHDSLKQNFTHNSHIDS